MPLPLKHNFFVLQGTRLKNKTLLSSPLYWLGYGISIIKLRSLVDQAKRYKMKSLSNLCSIKAAISVISSCKCPQLSLIRARIVGPTSLWPAPIIPWNSRSLMYFTVSWERNFLFVPPSFVISCDLWFCFPGKLYLWRWVLLPTILTYLYMLMMPSASTYHDALAWRCMVILLSPFSQLY